MLPTPDPSSSATTLDGRNLASRGSEIPAAWDEKALVVPSSNAPQPPAPRRSTFASACIIVACTSSLMMSIALGPSVSILLPSTGRDLHIPQENLQWVFDAYAISSVSNLKRSRRHLHGKAHLGPAHRHVYFFSADAWPTSTAASEFGLLDTSFW